MLDNLYRQSFWKLPKADLCIDVEKKRSQDQFPSNTSSQMAEPALLAVTDSKDKTLVTDKLHAQSNYCLSDKSINSLHVRTRCQTLFN